jgi:hypothetical protein
MSMLITKMAGYWQVYTRSIDAHVLHPKLVAY